MKRLLLPLLMSLAIAGQAAATTFAFDCISGGGTACGVGEAQLVMDVTDSGSGTVTITLQNLGPVGSAIANVYLDFGGILQGLLVVDGPGVDFALGGSPSNLPGGNAVGFHANARASADNPKPHNGVNPGESVSLVLTLEGKTFADVLQLLQSGEVAVGIHLIAIVNPECDFDGERGGDHAKCDLCDDLSASFVNDPSPLVPEPAAAALLGTAALVGLAVRRARR